MSRLQVQLRKAYESRTRLFGEKPPPIVKDRLDVVRKALLKNPPPRGADAQLLIKAKQLKQWFMLSHSVTLGADDENECRLDSEFVSGRHCSLEKEDDCWLLQDLESTNGVYVNGDKIDKVYLRDGDIIQLSDISIIFFKN